MSYTPTEWASGDIITAEKLNKLENGVENANSGNAIIINAIASQPGESGDAHLDRTFGEIRTLILAGYPIIIKSESNERLHVEMQIVNTIDWTVDDNNAYGSVGGYSAIIEEPYTLERLDTAIPYITW